ncbi:DUF533 domain-containing protein [Falsigemmobacter faecalis]|uniref:DUF533 domain-containing protein n=1 Tax=Falsigemmobacter faecalis TaxID=2488730 RepID=A0A3P3DSV5_9RHOB|nr:DUF533 domain-containing protein [Falsigemmobacter faecalis]RRH77309.1 DUF533 domain-containing protein [Falsigemmobacter faecalis]
MSFVRTLATLALGVAAVKGYGKVKQAGGLGAVQDALKKNPQTAGLAEQAEQVLGRLGAGAGGIVGTLTGMGAAAASGMTGMIDQITGTSVATETAEANARLMIRAMIQAARADGVIDDEERAVIMDHLKEASAEERAFVEEQMSAPVDALALARDASDAVKTQVYSAAAMTVRTDGPSETQFLASLARGMGLDAATVAGIHLSLGKAAPKA